MLRRPARMLGAALLFSAAAVVLAARAGRDWQVRVAVRGHSMEPTLRDGDWLLVDRRAYARREPVTGELVVAVDPRAPDRLVIKRAAPSSATELSLASDHPAHRHDQIGPVETTAVVGRPWLRYWPPQRLGLVT